MMIIWMLNNWDEQPTCEGLNQELDNADHDGHADYDDLDHDVDYDDVDHDDDYDCHADYDDVDHDDQVTDDHIFEEFFMWLCFNQLWWS